MLKLIASTALAFSIAAAASAQTGSSPAPAPNTGPTAPAPAAPNVAWPVKDGDFVVRNYRFKTGETLPEVKLRYGALGQPRRDAAGRVTNAVMLLHGTGGTGRQFLQPHFANELFGPGQPLDITKWYVIMPDNVGHGASSKPSDGLRAAFPKYDYDDMVDLQRRLLVDGLKVDRLALILGTSMGCMHAFVWGETHPDFAQRLAPFACQPVEIAGRNRMWRKMTMDAVRADPAYQEGNYTTQPLQGIRTAVYLSILAGSAPLPMQLAYPTRESAEAYLAERTPRDMATRDANDMIWQLDASRTYDPSKDLEKITAKVLWINSADDFINPPELGIAERMAPRLRNGRFILLPATERTKGHSSHTWAVLWKDELAKLLAN
jgi:homoserine O-acetyltransferase